MVGAGRLNRRSPREGISRFDQFDTKVWWEFPRILHHLVGQLRRLSCPTVRDRHAARSSPLCVHAGLRVSFSSAASDNFAIFESTTSQHQPDPFCIMRA